jgi:uncharacterized protein (TIGR02246 family)
MQKVFIGIFVLFFCFFGTVAQADTTNDEIAKVGFTWGKALESRQPQKIADLYSPHAYLYPTFEDIKESPKEILSYFEQLSQNEDLHVTFNKQHIQVFGNVAINSGFYTFSYKKDGEIVNVPARFTFVYIHEGNHWLIINHHSSILPKP